MAFIFGLYQIPHSKVADAITVAYDLGIRNFDSAQLYGNERICADTIRFKDNCIMTSKIYHVNTPQQMERKIKRSLKIMSQVHRAMLLHRWMTPEMYHQLALNCDFFINIGVSNYDIPKLQELLDYCALHKIQKPEVVQIEVHPFVDCIPMIKFCNKNNIIVEGHTVLARGKYFNYQKLVDLSVTHNCTVPQIMVSWALSKKIHVCIKSLHKDRLEELLNSPRNIDLSCLDDEYKNHTHRFYKIGGDDHNNIIAQLQADMVTDLPSKLCENLPLAGYDFVTKGTEIANVLFPDAIPTARLNKYRKLIKELRSKRLSGLQVEKRRKKGLTCNLRNEKGYTRSMTHPMPMPVDETDPVEFIPFYEYITSVEPSTIDESSTFVKGTMFGDGRMDLCKQVVGPSSMEALCESADKSTVVKHFLLGNNIAFMKPSDDKSLRSARAISDLMRKSQIETYYLAGNCIDHNDMDVICQGLMYNKCCKALWLKRNPVKPLGAMHLNRLLSTNRTLKVLDLHNCALGDTGLDNLFAHPENIMTLKHIYLDANMIENLEPLIKWIETGAKITSLYLSINRLGDQEVIKLCKSLTGSQTLKRLCLASTLTGNEAVPHIVDMALSCPNLICINLGCYKSTADMGERPGNLFDDDVTDHFKRLLQHDNLKYFNVLGCQMSHGKLEELKLVNEYTTVETGSGQPKFVHDKNQLQIIKHTKRVIHIASVYRGKM